MSKNGIFDWKFMFLYYICNVCAFQTRFVMEIMFLRINRNFCPNVIEKEYFCNYERFWILCRSERRVYCDTAAPFVQYQEAPDASGQV